MLPSLSPEDQWLKLLPRLSSMLSGLSCPTAANKTCQLLTFPSSSTCQTLPSLPAKTTDPNGTTGTATRAEPTLGTRTRATPSTPSQECTTQRTASTTTTPRGTQAMS